MLIKVVPAAVSLPPMFELVAGVLVNMAFAGLAFWLKTVSSSGAAMGMLLGLVVFWCAGWQGFALLFGFFAIGTAATKVGYRRKLAAGIAQEKGGARGWEHALANAGGPALLALSSWLTPYRDLFLLGFAASLATATGDTVSSEIGKAFGKRTFLITTFKPVPPGTTGAVSLEGTLAGILASLFVAFWAYSLRLVAPSWLFIVAIAGSVGFFLEGYVGAIFEKGEGQDGILNNEQVNFINTMMGAIIAIAIVLLTGFAR